jgi:hypothetical protein
MSKQNVKRKRNEGQSAETDEEDKKPKASTNNKSDKIAKKSGFDDIDDLFASKKERVAGEKKKDEEDEKKESQKRKFFQQNASSGSSTVNAKKKALSGDKTDVTSLTKNEWVNDGLGGIFDKEGFTGRKEDGVKVFKAHLFNKKGFGTTKDCPFDCDCCYI